MGTDCPCTRIDHRQCSNNHQRWWYDNVNDMLKICTILILFINFAACSLERSAVEEWDFYFSWEQFSAEGKIGYYQHRSGKIYVFTDYRSKSRSKFPNREYRKTQLYIGSGVRLDKKNVDRSKVIWPAHSFKPEEGQ